MPEHEVQENLLSFLGQHKYEVARLFQELDRSPELERRFHSVLQPIADETPWPPELRSWRALLLGLLGNEIGGIASTMARENAAEELFETGERQGISRTAISMIAGQVYGIRQKLTSVTISVR